MNRNSVETEMKANSDSIVLKIRQLNNFSLQEKIFSFLESRERKILIFKTSEIISFCARIHQTLKDLQMDEELRDRSKNKLENFVNENQIGFLEWSKLLELHSKYDEVPISVNLLVILSADEIELKRDGKNALKNMLSYLGDSRKKIVLLTTQHDIFKNYLQSFVTENAIYVEEVHDRKFTKESTEVIVGSSEPTSGDGNNVLTFKQRPKEDITITNTIEDPNCPVVVKNFFQAVSETNLKKLLEYLKIGINKEDLNSALYKAGREGKSEVLEILISHGAKFSVVGDSKETLLHIAAELDHCNIIDCLSKYLIHVDYINDKGETALHVAAEKGNSNAVECLLINGAQVDYTGTTGKTALHVAAGKGHKNVLDCLLNRGAQVDQICKSGYYTDGMTALHFAAENGHKDKDVFISLLNANADINKLVSGSNKSVLDFAAAKNHCNIIDEIYNRKHNLDIDNKHCDGGYTALMVAVSNGFMEMVAKLIDLGADINAQIVKPGSYSEGDTALHIAARNNKYEIVKLLVDRGANKSLKNERGKTAYSISTELHIQQLLRPYS